MGWPRTILVCALFVLGVTSCAAPGDEGTSATEAEGPERETAVEAADAPADVEEVPDPDEWVGEVTLGRSVSAEGGVSEPTETFVAGGIVNVGVEIGEAPPGAAVRVVFVPPDGGTLGEDEKKVPVGAERLVFQSPDTSDWQPGRYRAELWVGEARVASRTFSLRASAS